MFNLLATLFVFSLIINVFTHFRILRFGLKFWSFCVFESLDALSMVTLNGGGLTQWKTNLFSLFVRQTGSHYVQSLLISNHMLKSTTTSTPISFC